MEEKAKHCVYMLRCKDGTYYTGYTNNIDRRLRMHDKGKGAKYTRGRGPFELVYRKEYATKREALQAEYQIKQLERKEKQNMIISYSEGQDDNGDTA